jgi:hypothetical protein
MTVFVPAFLFAIAYVLPPQPLLWVRHSVLLGGVCFLIAVRGCAPWAPSHFPPQVEKSIESQTHEMTEQFNVLNTKRTKLREEIKELEELLNQKRKEEAQATKMIDEVGLWYTPSPSASLACSLVGATAPAHVRPPPSLV